MNISSIIIKTNDLEGTAERLSEIDKVEVCLKEDTTIIAVIEAENVSDEVEALKQIEMTQGVISASLHYSYIEDELRDEMSAMEQGAPHILNDENVESIPYSGSIETMMKK